MGYTNFENLPSQNTPFSSTILKQMQIGLMEMVFPIGSTYITQEEINPSTILEFGTWERVKGKVLVGLDENDEAFNTIGKTGGEKTHTLTVTEMPKHRHDKIMGQNGTEERVGAWGTGSEHKGLINEMGTNGYESLGTNETGGSQAHNNLQPYQVIGYMWVRTA